MHNVSREQQIIDLQEAVHSELDYSRYNSTVVRDNTNCYSHAIGSTLPHIGLYRIGAISGRKPIYERYFSEDEVVSLLKEDIHVLGLKIEESFLGDVFQEGQYQIALYLAIYTDEKIHDFHFYRNDSFGWSEKWWSRNPQMHREFEEKNFFPWKFVGFFKITK